ncbi:MAG: two-component regulator propeller domain-containing protein, partial [Bacteroidota bacterium]
MNAITISNAISGDRRLFNFYFNGDDLFISAAFGLVKVDMATKDYEVRFTTFTPFEVRSAHIYNGFLYASTENGIYRVPANSSDIVITDFGNWEQIGEMDGLPSAYYSNAMTTWQDKLYADVNDSLFVYDGNNWNNFYFFQDGYSIEHLQGGVDRLVLTMPNPGNVDRVVLVDEQGAAFAISSNELVGKNGQALQDDEGNVWIADAFRGMNLLTDDGAIESISVNGPYSNSSGEIEVFDNKVYVAAITLWPSWAFQVRSDGFFVLEEGTWTTHRPFEVPELEGLWDMCTAAVNPATGIAYIGSFPQGLIEFDGTNYTVYNETNSGIQIHATDPFTRRVAGLVFDESNNLWISNFGAPNPVVVLTADGEWYNFGSGFGFTQPTQIVVDQNNFKWFVGGDADKGILVYDSGAEISSTTDDRNTVLRTNTSSLITNDVRCLAVDKDGFVWAGTTSGPLVFECASQVFDGLCPGRRPTAVEGGITDFLLGGETINTIAIDGANRKWFGTDNGLFLLNEQADEEILKFTIDNSPLFSNRIIDIEINEENGEVFIGTDGGILSYRSDATEGGAIFGDVVAFPNPVRPEYEGPIAIKGLVSNAEVKITDISGTLIYEGRALGGQAIWDGNDYNGRRASSGVYLVWLTDRDGNQKMVTKLLVIN